MIKERFTKIVIVMSSRTEVLVLRYGHISHIVKMHYFFKNLLFYSQACVDKKNLIYSNDKQGRVYKKILISCPPGQWFLC